MSWREMPLPPDRAAVWQVPALLSVRSVAEMLDVSQLTIRRRIADGSLPAVRDQGRVMIRADELRDYIERLERIGESPARRTSRRAPGKRFDFLHE